VTELTVNPFKKLEAAKAAAASGSHPIKSDSTTDPSTTPTTTSTTDSDDHIHAHTISKSKVAPSDDPLAVNVDNAWTQFYQVHNLSGFLVKSSAPFFLSVD
jgi:hypothetical protein